MTKKLFAGCFILVMMLFTEGVWLLSRYNIESKWNTGGVDPVKLKEQSFAAPNLDIKLPDGSLWPQEDPEEEKPVNILVLGLDGYEARADVILLFNFSLSQGKLNILSVPRDTRLRRNGKDIKINSLINTGGERLTAETVSEITGLPVDYYLTLNFKGFRKIIDTLDGLEFYVPFNMNYDDYEQNLHIHLKKGWQVLDGYKAECLIRYRKGNAPGSGYTDGDLGRINTQQNFVKAFIQQKIKLKYLSKVDEIFHILKEYMNTNIEIDDVRHYLNYIKAIRYDEIKTFTLPGDTKYFDNTWYYIYDKEKTKEMIEEEFFR